MRQLSAGSQPGLYWRPDLIAEVMAANGVQTRGQLAVRLEVPRQTVYRGFTEDWHGRVSEQLLLAMVAGLTIPQCKHCGLPRLIELIQLTGR